MSMTIEMNGKTIFIDDDKKCEECSKGGAAPNGLCLKCTGKIFQGKPMRSDTGKLVALRFKQSRPARR